MNSDSGFWKEKIRIIVVLLEGFLVLAQNLVDNGPRGILTAFLIVVVFSCCTLYTNSSRLSFGCQGFAHAVKAVHS